MRRPNDTELIRKGEALTEFNDNAATIFRLDQLKRQANFARGIYNHDGLIMHLTAVRGMELELSGKLTDNEITNLKKKRVSEIPFNKTPGMNFVYAWKKKLEDYEQYVRELLQKKGLGVTAKIDDDPGKAILE